ncbi:MAG: pyridoxamine 5'-phosphate oxidase [Gemmatimonadetes bacterium]|nr:pyridoxamine 5'-phosphate oxidase [Gemmatimonadota bacterium]
MAKKKARRKKPQGSSPRYLLERDADPNPIRQFELWLDDARRARVIEPTAMTLATTTRAGVPSARVLLLKGVDRRGFVFFTNYESQKGRELGENPRAALVFWWGKLERQVKVSGAVTRVPDAESDVYFATRPAGSRIGAIASAQSTVLASREELDRRVRELTKQYPDGDVPRPPHWGGFRLNPDMLEFWQGRADRLHDRLRYRREGSAWIVERLSP